MVQAGRAGHADTGRAVMGQNNIDLCPGKGQAGINLLIGYDRTLFGQHGVHVGRSAQSQKTVALYAVNRAAGQIGEKGLILFGQLLKSIEILMVAVDEIQGPPKALPFFYEKIVQMGSVDAEVPQVNDAGDRHGRARFRHSQAAG